LFKEDFFCGTKIDTFDVMKILYSISFITFYSLSSCFIADGIFLENESSEESLESKVQKEISEYIKGNSDNYTYKSYGFSELIIKKPAELVVLDDLKRKQALNSNQTKINLQITTLDSTIKAENIRYSLEMDHEYSLKNKQTNAIELYETKFILADSIHIKNLTPLLNLKLTDEDVVIFENYFYETPIFLSGTYSESKTLSIEFYNFLKQHQDKLIGVKQKSNFMKHCLNICRDIKVDGTFDQNYYLLTLADRKIRSDTTIQGYKSIQFSPLFETTENKEVVNYYFFHNFTSTKNNILDTLSTYIEFSPYYELKLISEPGKTYNNYFNN